MNDRTAILKFSRRTILDALLWRFPNSFYFPVRRLASQQRNSLPVEKALIGLIRRIDSSTSLVKGYIDDGNFDGFLIHARKGLLRLRGPITDERKERKVGSFIFFFFFEFARATWWGSVILIPSRYLSSSYITFSSSSVHESRSAPSTFLWRT